MKSIHHKIHIAIGALVVKRNKNNRLLISMRPKGQRLAGYWELPGGKIEQGETPQQALVREFKEELGITVCVEEHLATLEDVLNDQSCLLLHVYRCEHVYGESANQQVAAHKWVTAKELADYKFPPANAPLLPILQKYLLSMDE